ncbi:hypothetical protein N0V93_002730 [Gnomoniopsis smithogilvyi]|uniref:BTB domain-containing protein n=1 Tax=Gnomoniopsis smithogilvyi TaxID=1191159 RepID=A0A9W8YX81_9PEZI|nr:hypothetical protein N0V93_002730 [Gnomoniopsis smithogilvyi]
MPTTIDSPVDRAELQAENLPLPESRPSSPAKLDEPPTSPPIINAQVKVIPSITIQAPQIEDGDSTRDAEVVKSDMDSVIGPYKSKYSSNVNTSPETEPKVEIDATMKIAAATKSSDQFVNLDNMKHPNDFENSGNIAKTFFTSELESCSSPIHEYGRINLKFSEMADLFIKATDHHGRFFVFQVHSATLEAASTVFYDMIYTSNTRGNKEAWVWELKDSVIGLKVMFSLLHLNYRASLITEQPDSHQVYDVLRVLAKYGIRDEAFHPFAKSWVDGFRDGLDYSLSVLTHLERLYTAYKLGDFKNLKISIRKVAHSAEVSEDGSLLLDNRPIKEIVPISDELVANVNAVRNEDLKNLLQPLKIAYDTLMGDTKDQNAADFCKSTDGHNECQEKLLGSLLGNLRRQKLSPIPISSTYTGSVGTLAEKVSQMDICGLIVPNLEPHKQRHSRCKLGQDDVAKQLLDGKAYVPIYDDLVEQIFFTAKRGGINTADEEEYYDDYKDVFKQACIKYHQGLRYDFWGWNEDKRFTGTLSAASKDESGIDEASDSKSSEASLDLTISVDSTS